MDCFFTFKNRLRHFLLAKDEYSLHSPFMFDLFTKGLKQKDKTLPAKGRKERFFCRLAKYFQPKSILILSEKDNGYADCISKTLPQSTLCHVLPNEKKDWCKDLQNVDFAILDLTVPNQDLKTLFETLLPYCSQESLIILTNIDRNRAVNSFFEQMKSDQRLKVCADFGFCGVSFLTQKPFIKQNYILKRK